MPANRQRVKAYPALEVECKRLEPEQIPENKERNALNCHRPPEKRQLVAGSNATIT